MQSKSQRRIPLLVITGPTASGKTEVATAMALILEGEIISADSMQIYRFMDIGTAKTNPEKMQGIPHHLIDIVDPDTSFTAAVFQKLARKAISDVYERNRTPLLVGGTGFYIDAVLYDYDFSNAEADPEFRLALRQKAAQDGNEVIYRMLQEVDPYTASRLHINDLKRVIRALEIHKQTGAPGALFRDSNRQFYPDYNLLLIGLHYQRELLYKRIEMRVESMLEQGLIEEVRSLLEKGYHRELISMQGLGYKEIAGFINGEYSLVEAVELLKRNTRRFAKRQLTWLRRYSNINWIDMEKYDTMDGVLEYIEQQWRLLKATIEKNS